MFPPKLKLPNVSLKFDLEISKMKLQTNELKRCQKRNLIKLLKTRKGSIQADPQNLHYVPGKHGLNRTSLQRPRRNPCIEVYAKHELSRRLKHFYWEIRTAKGDEFEPSSLKTIQRGLDRYLQEKRNARFSIILAKSSLTLMKP